MIEGYLKKTTERMESSLTEIEKISKGVIRRTGQWANVNPNFTLYSPLDDLFVLPPQACFYIQNVIRVPRVVGVLDELVPVI